MTEGSVSQRKAVASWCLFDFGNSSFTTVIITAVFNVYFVTTIAPESGTKLWSIGLLISNFIVILTAPVIGAIADYSGQKKRFLLASFLTCIVLTASLYFLGPGDVILALTLVILANAAFASGENLISAFLPDLVEPKDIAKVSSWGWGVGYIGGLLALGLCWFALDKGWGGQSCGLIVAAFFLIGGTPTFLFVKEKQSRSMPMSEAISAGMAESAKTLKDRSQLPDLFRFFVAALVLQIGIYGVIQYAGIYGTKLAGLSQKDVTLILLVSQISAFVGALSSSHIAHRIGSTNTVRLTTLFWSVAGALLLLKSDRLGFWAAALIAGFAMGASLSTIRATVALLTPKGKSGEIFGFWGFFGRVAAVLAPLGNLGLLMITNERLESGIAYFLGCFVLSFILLGRVDEQRGRALAGSL